MLLVLFVLSIALSFPAYGGSTEEAGTKHSSGYEQTCEMNGDCKLVKDTSTNLQESTVLTEGSSEGENEELQDNNNNCDLWASLGECEKNPGYMLQSCRKSCNKIISSESSTEELNVGVEQVVKATGINSSEIRELIQDSELYLKNEIMSKPEYAKIYKECANGNKDCAFWAFGGECKANPDFMNYECKLACKTCHLLDINIRCPLDPNAKEAIMPGDLDKLFERITDTSPESEFAKYQPVVLSRPSVSKKADAQETPERKQANFPQVGPWVAEFKSFLTAEECDRIIALGIKLGYERSTGGGGIKADGKIKDIVVDTRTSSNTWCRGNCERDPIITTVTERISNVTGVPMDNFEHLQLLQYQVGQFYQAHHDFIPVHVKRQCGPRILTFFLYLNDVDKGGGTNFPELDNLTVMPKKGKALLWPSVINSDPNKFDPGTRHEALPVERGVKFAANAWIHLRDFQNTLEAGCI